MPHGGEWDIDDVLASVVGLAAAGEKLVPNSLLLVVQVQGEEEESIWLRVPPHDVLCTITVVYIQIDDSHSFAFMRFQGM